MIELDRKYSIKADPHCWVLQKRNGTDKKTGKALYDQTYHSSLHLVLSAYTDARLRDSAPKSFEDVAKTIKAIKKHLTQINDILREILQSTEITSDNLR